MSFGFCEHCDERHVVDHECAPKRAWQLLLHTMNIKSGELVETDCENCAGLYEALVRAEQDARLAEKDLRNERRENARLHGALERQEAEDRRRPVAEAIFRYWTMRCKKASTTQFTEERVKAVYARLAQYTPTYIARAIDGLAVSAYRNPDSGKIYNDLELVCRNGSKLEHYHEMAELLQAPTLVGPAWLHEFGMYDEA